MKRRHLVYFIILIVLTFGVLFYTDKATYPNVVKKCFTWACWVWIYFSFVPLADRKQRSTSAWFWLGAASFWGSYASVFIAGLLAVQLGRKAISSFGIDSACAIQIVVGLSIIVAITGMRLTARYLRNLPDIIAPSQQSVEPDRVR